MKSLSRTLPASFLAKRSQEWVVRGIMAGAAASEQSPFADKLCAMDTSNHPRELSKAAPSARMGALGAIIAILVLTVLEFPPPIGFETRPQTNVSVFWLLFFLLILVTEIAAIALIIKRARLGWKFGIGAGVLNILQVIADQAHLMQPEVAPLGYSLLEGAVVVASLALIYFALKIREA